MADHCQFFVVRKKRYCRMTLRPGSKFCGEHEPKTESTGNEILERQENIRIACPLDPKHTCYANKLEKHLKVCNAREKYCPPYIVKNFNINEADISNEDRGTTAKRCLSNVSEDLLKEVIGLVEKVYDEIILGNITTFPNKECHKNVIGDLNNDGRGEGTRRHLLQTSALLHILQSKDLMAENTSFVELGAGKGHLSYYLSKAVNDISGCSVILVDKASHRHKQDNKLKEDCLVKIDRIRADISDLVLSKIPSVETSKCLVAVSKHLCGVATDLAFTCLTNSNIIDKTKGLVMATCCHHRCEWDNYVGKSFLEINGFTRSKFDVICGLVSWAVCGSGLSRERKNNIQNKLSFSKEPKKSKVMLNTENIASVEDTVTSNNDNCNDMSDFEKLKNDQSDSEQLKNEQSGSEQLKKDQSTLPQDNKLTKDSLNAFSISKNIGLTLDRREEIGFKAKAVIDWGRMTFLKENSFQSYLCFYVDKVLSPENVCIVATK